MVGRFSIKNDILLIVLKVKKHNKIETIMKIIIIFEKLIDIIILI